MKNDIPNIPNYLHLSDPNILQYEFNHMVINFITRFPWYFEINLWQLLLQDFFPSRQKRHISEYFCKISLKELREFSNKNQKALIMLTFMNSKLTKMTGKDKQDHIFQKCKSYEYIYIYIHTYIYIYFIYLYVYAHT